MVKNINIELFDYNLEDATIAIIRKMIEDNPEISIELGAKNMGISVRTLYRWMKKYDLSFPSKIKKQTIVELKAIQILKSRGYKIKK